MIFGREPVVFLTALGVLLDAVLQFLISAGVITISTDQQEQFRNLIHLVIAIVVGFITRNLVTPVSDPRGKDGQALS